MWTSDRGRRHPVEESGADLGPVTVAGETTGVYLEGERREMQVISPGGYHWRPAPDDRVLVLKAGGEREEPCIIGKEQRKKLNPGEVAITSGTEKSELRLSSNGELDLKGNVLINGQPLTKLIAQIVYTIVSGGTV